jgi:hypothetical protein
MRSDEKMSETAMNRGHLVMKLYGSMRRASCPGTLILILVAVAAIAGCSTTYQPRLSLPPANVDQSIDAAVELHPLVVSEDVRHGHSPYGVVADDYKNPPPSEMSDAVTAEILHEFTANRVFRRISTYDPNPEFILTGRIDRFFEHDRRKLWAYVPFSQKVANLFRLNTYMGSGEVHITMTLLNPSGEPLNSYVGHAKFEEDFTPNDETAPGGRLNGAFSEAVNQIREEMLADPKLAKTRNAEPLVHLDRKK